MFCGVATSSTLPGGRVRSCGLVFAIVFLLLASTSEASAQHPRATIAGSVTDATSRRALDGVTVWLADGLATVTGGRGRFEIKRVPAGTYRVRVSRIGYRAKTFEVPVAGDDRDIYLTLSLEPLPVELEPVVIRGDTNTVVAYGRMADFFRRKRRGWGRFITRMDIERRNPFRVSDLLRSVPGVWMRYDRFGQAVVTFRGYGALRQCPPAVYLDHVRMPSGFGFTIDDWVQPHDIEGIEVYNGYASTPAEFYGGCGAIVIWTR